MKNKLPPIVCILLVFSLIVISGCSSNRNLVIRFPKIGSADAFLLYTNQFSAMIDTGEKDDAEELLTKLKNMGIDRLDVLILTHFDKDHIGSAVPIIQAFSPKKVYLPAYEGSSKLYLALMEALQTAGKKTEVYRLKEDISFSSGRLGISISVPGHEAEGSDADNEQSLCVSVTYGETAFLFPGDAMEKRLTELMDGPCSCTLLKVPHHGKYNSKTADFLSAASPVYAIIPDSDKNPADKETLKALTDIGVEIFETRHGDIRAVSDGKTVSVFRES